MARWRLALVGAVVSAAILWAYWPTLAAMAAQWEREPDYSHGYLVAPIAVLFLWLRRESFPGRAICPSAWGGILLLTAIAGRAAAALFYMQPLDGWTLPLTVAGAVWMLLGWSALRWSLPSIAFLWFMVPIPFSMEQWLSVPLQRIATNLSTMALVSLGQPAIAEGNTILLGDNRLFVEEACSGLRIFVGIMALAFAFVLFSRWSWWQKALVLVAVVPVAIFSNVVRIVATALLQELASSEAADKFSHDISGFVMIPLAALLFWLLLVYLEKLFPVMEDVRVLPAHRQGG